MEGGLASKPTKVICLKIKNEYIDPLTPLLSLISQKRSLFPPKVFQKIFVR